MERDFVPYEQALELKELGFDEPCYRTYDHKQKLSPFPITENIGGEKVDPLSYKWNNSEIHPSSITAPEQWQVVEWLRVKHGIWIEVRHIKTFGINRFHIIIWDHKDTKDYYTIYHDGFGPGYKVWDTPQEAYSAAFDYIKNNNLI